MLKCVKKKIEREKENPIISHWIVCVYVCFSMKARLGKEQIRVLYFLNFVTFSSVRASHF